MYGEGHELVAGEFVPFVVFCGQNKGKKMDIYNFVSVVLGVFFVWALIMGFAVD